MNHEVEVGGYESYENEVHNEEMFIGDSNAETFTRGTDKGDIQSPVQVNRESKILENNFSISLVNFRWTFKNLGTSIENPLCIKQVAYMMSILTFLSLFTSSRKRLHINFWHVLNAGEDAKSGVSAKVQGL